MLRKAFVLLPIAGLIAACSGAPGQAVSQDLSGERSVSQEQIRTELVVLAEQAAEFMPLSNFTHDMTYAQAYGWQQVFVEQIEPSLGEVIAYKTGGHSPGAVGIFANGPLRGQLPEGLFLQPGATLSRANYSAGLLEADFALRVGDESINSAESDMELLASLDAIVPFIEILNPQDEPGPDSSVKPIVTAMLSRHAIAGDPILIEANEGWMQKINQLEFAVLDENDRVWGRGTMASWYQPLKVVRWLRDNLHEHGIELQRGDVLSLGNIGFILPMHSGTDRGAAFDSSVFRVVYFDLDNQGGTAEVSVSLVD